jgi:peptide/nickel transport system permease protein
VVDMEKKQSALMQKLLGTFPLVAMLRSKRVASVCAIIIIFFYLVSIFVLAAGQEVIPFDPLLIRPSQAFLPPSLAHPFGTDQYGVDVFRNVLYAAPLDMSIPVAVVAVALIVGGFIGAFAAIYGGIVDEILMRVTDIFRAFPSLVLALAIAAALGRNPENAMLALMIVWWPAYARIARGETLVVKNKDFVRFARVVGISPTFIIVKHVLPNVFQILITYATADIGNVLVSFSVLGYLGLGPQPPTPEWGRLVFAGQDFITSAPWVPLFPALMIFLIVISFSLLGDGLRDILDPRLRESV